MDDRCVTLTTVECEQELLHGETPFLGASDAATFARIQAAELRYPEGGPALSEHCRSLLGALLVAEPSARLGFHAGASEIKQHGWFSGVRWALLQDEPAPIVPPQPPLSPIAPTQPLSKVLAHEHAQELLDDGVDAPRATEVGIESGAKTGGSGDAFEGFAFDSGEGGGAAAAKVRVKAAPAGSGAVGGAASKPAKDWAMSAEC